MSHPSIYFIMGEASEGYTVSSLNKKITFWKLHHHTCKLGRALPPPHLDKIQKNSYFFSSSFPRARHDLSYFKKFSKRLLWLWLYLMKEFQMSQVFPVLNPLLCLIYCQLCSHLKTCHKRGFNNQLPP